MTCLQVIDMEATKHEINAKKCNGVLGCMTWIDAWCKCKLEHAKCMKWMYMDNVYRMMHDDTMQRWSHEACNHIV